MDIKIKKNFNKLSKRNKISVLSITAVLFIFILWLLFSGKNNEEEIPTYKVHKSNFLISLSESGELIAKNSITITAPRVRGTLKIVYLIPEGKYVAAGEVLVKFDPTESLAKVQEEQSKLEMALSEKDKLLANHASSDAQMESQLKSAELSFELSKLNLEQMKFEAEAKQREAKLNHQKNELSYLQTKQEFEEKILHKSPREVKALLFNYEDKKAVLEFERNIILQEIIIIDDTIINYNRDINDLYHKKDIAVMEIEENNSTINRLKKKNY